jgi:hypothetical protein
MVQDAKRRGVVALPVDVTISGWGSFLEGAKLSRLVMRLTFPSLAVHVLQADVGRHRLICGVNSGAESCETALRSFIAVNRGQQSLHRLDGGIRT